MVTESRNKKNGHFIATKEEARHAYERVAPRLQALEPGICFRSPWMSPARRAWCSPPRRHSGAEEADRAAARARSSSSAGCISSSERSSVECSGIFAR